MYQNRHTGTHIQTDIFMTFLNRPAIKLDSQHGLAVVSYILARDHFFLILVNMLNIPF